MIAEIMVAFSAALAVATAHKDHRHNILLFPLSFEESHEESMIKGVGQLLDPALFNVASHHLHKYYVDQEPIGKNVVPTNYFWVPYPELVNSKSHWADMPIITHIVSSANEIYGCWPYLRGPYHLVQQLLDSISTTNWTVMMFDTVLSLCDTETVFQMMERQPTITPVMFDPTLLYTHTALDYGVPVPYSYRILTNKLLI